MACTNRAISGCVARVAGVNVSYETHEANIVEGQSCHAPALNIPQLQVIGAPNNP